MKEPDYQWQGAQGYQWWDIDIVRDKFSSSENELLVKINDSFIVRAFTTRRSHDYYDSEIHINNAYYQTSCEHVDEDLYWLFENLEKLIFLQNIKKNKVKAINQKRFEKRKDKLLSKLNIKVFTVFGEINYRDRACPVCGKMEFPQEICRFCGWEDESVDDPNVGGDGSGPNYMSLNAYKEKHAQRISIDPNYIWEKAFKRGKFDDPLIVSEIYRKK
ncbi:hypothetical protein FACS1894211_08390 [Clostridia bacterium]|nr:hypothetical protein FACS1894211_08390 [Clostridia bacterium]